jgi:SAM-dependent methyltransferase
MNSYSKETYGERIAAVYDDWFAEYDSDAIDVLAELAQGGRALELGIGTGRFALPLSAKGVEVHGVDAATSMVARLKEKPGADRIAITMGNFADVPVDGKFAVIYIVFNTFFALSSQEEQVRCFRNVAAHLQPGGCFVMEAFVPDVARFTSGQVNWATKVTADEVQLDVGQHDAATQRVNSQRVVLTEGNVRLYPVQIRYCWPSELDLMAQLAGLRLRERWENWKREPFTSKSVSHISIYE